mmetsp:Transcript_4176/g.8975  ORF Transcript_4176/g.8975 Transcript_4176/m.8975 type:complete len:80 (+) Transcript_4176:49-288(+)
MISTINATPERSDGHLTPSRPKISKSQETQLEADLDHLVDRLRSGTKRKQRNMLQAEIPQICQSLVPKTRTKIQKVLGL